MLTAAGLDVEREVIDSGDAAEVLGEIADLDEQGGLLQSGVWCGDHHCSSGRCKLAADQSWIAACAWHRPQGASALLLSADLLPLAPLSKDGGALCAGGYQPALVCEDDGLDSVTDPELREQAGDVGFDRALADEQLGGQLGVALTARQHRQHLALALRQGVQPRAELRPDRPACELLDDAPRDRGGEQSLAGSHDVHRVQELLGWGVLEQEAAGARPQGLEHVLVTLERGEDHHTTVQLAVFGNPPRGLESVTVGHLDVHQHDVGPQAPGAGRGLLAVRRLAENLDLGIGLEDHPEAGANHRLVIGQQHTDAHSAPSGVGSLTRTANPPPDTGPAVSWPPCRAARSRMPINPRPPGLVPDSAVAPRPSSMISTSSSSGQYRTRTSARDAAACLRVLVSASCTMRYADTPIIGGNERSSPSMLTATASSDSLMLAASRGS